jgi:large subunit ribosomal protein L18
MSFERQKARERRHRRVRKKIFGTAQRPRFCVYKSLKHLSVQIIDDAKGATLLGLSTNSSDLRSQGKRGNVDGAKALGKLVAERAKAKNIENVVFDRGGYIYHGCIRALAEAAREEGIKF